MREGAGDIKVVFFDLGKVILRFSHEDIIGRLLSRSASGAGRSVELFDYLFDAGEGLCNLYDEGRISSEDFYSEIDARFGLGVDYAGFVPLWNGIFTEAVEVSAIIREVKRGRPVFLLSNVNELHWEFVRGCFPILSEMDGHVLSCAVKAKKPSPAIYEAAKELAGVGPGESVFVDDLPENTAAAGRCGIMGITYTDPARLREELAGLGLT